MACGYRRNLSVGDRIRFVAMPTGFGPHNGHRDTLKADLARFADALLRFADGGPPVEFEAGTGAGIGLIGLRFYHIDRAGHIACHTRLALSGVRTERRPEQVSRLEVEFGAEAWAVEQFARRLAEIARTQEGQASLVIEA